MENNEVQKHPNSRIVTLRRNESFLSKAQGDGIKDFITSSIQGIGSYFEGKNSQRTSSGMTLAEERILLPEVLGAKSDDRAYIELRTKYFANFETKVPNKGLQLEIGLSHSNAESMNETNLPISLDDYLRYRHAIKHPWVGASLVVSKGNQLKKFYVDDPVAATSANADVNKLNDEAMIYYLSVKDSPAKIEMALTLCGVDYRDIAGQSAEQTTQLRQERLRSIVANTPKVVVDMTNEKNPEIMYTIKMMTNVGVLRIAGNKYVEVETGEPIGNLEETILFFKDTTANSDKIALLKSKMQEGVKANKRTKQGAREVAKK